jgi:hypothetical protein
VAVNEGTIMKPRLACLVAAAAALAAPAFAMAPSGDAAVTSSTGAAVSSGTGLIVTPGAPSASVTVMPGAAATLPDIHLLPGAATVQSSSTTVLGGPAAGNVASSQTIITQYWTNVPANVTSRPDFQRWMRLWP